MTSKYQVTLISSSVEETLRIVERAAVKCSAVFAEGLTKPALNGWVPLEPEPATSAYIDLEAALAAVQEATLTYTGVEQEVVAIIEQQLLKHAPKTYADYLERAHNALSYSAATISQEQDQDLSVRAHSSRSKSAVNQLNGLASTSNELLAHLAQNLND